MPEQLFFTRILNHIFATPVTNVLTALHLAPSNPAAPVDNTVAMEVLVALVLLVFFVATRMSLKVEKPGPVQHVAEMMHEFVSTQGESIIGHGYERYIPFLTIVGVFILLSNLLGLVPGFESPTASPVVPLGVALLAFTYYNYHGLREQGPIGYLKHFMGPVWWIAWLLFPIEIISHLARILSLTVRLYANMFAGDLVTLAFFSLVPIGVPIIFLGLHLGVAIIQAYVFMLLSMIYISGAVAHEH